MYVFIPDPRDMFVACVLAVIAILISATAVDAIYFTHPGDPQESGVTRDMWAQIDAGSLSTMHRGEPANEVLVVSYTPADEPVDTSVDIASLVEGWLLAAAEGGAIGGIPG